MNKIIRCVIVLSFLFILVTVVGIGVDWGMQYSDAGSKESQFHSQTQEVLVTLDSSSASGISNTLNASEMETQQSPMTKPELNKSAATSPEEPSNVTSSPVESDIKSVKELGLLQTDEVNIDARNQSEDLSKPRITVPQKVSRISSILGDSVLSPPSMYTQVPPVKVPFNYIDCGQLISSRIIGDYIECMGTDQNDDIVGNASRNAMYGLKGDDSMSGKGGSDLMDGGDGVDTMDGRNGNDDMRGGNGRNNMTGGDGNDRMSGGDGNDMINGGNGNDKIQGLSGFDYLKGGNGNDLIYQFSPSFRGGINPDGSKDFIDCGPGQDEAWIQGQMDGDTAVNCEIVHSDVAINTKPTAGKDNITSRN